VPTAVLVCLRILLVEYSPAALRVLYLFYPLQVIAHHWKESGRGKKTLDRQIQQRYNMSAEQNNVPDAWETDWETLADVCYCF
jgi:hypothetical protein